MVNVIQGDLLKSHMQTLVNTVNCVGIMGKGIALAFRRRFPEMFDDYSRRCQAGKVQLGRPYLYKPAQLPWILNFPTKDHWRSFSHVADIENGLHYLLEHYRAWGIQSLAVPPLGCGQGQLEWRVVGPTIYRYLKQLDIPVELYAPHETPSEELQTSFLDHSGKTSEILKIDPAWLALVEILHRIEAGSCHWPVGRTTFQKIGYAASEEGLPLNLAHQKGDFGPFAPGLKSIESRLLQHGLIREGRHDRHFEIKVGPTYADAKKAYADDLAPWEPLIVKTADLFMRTNAEQAELVATVIYAARHLVDRTHGRPAERDVLREVVRWKKTRLKPGEISLAIRNLAGLGWIDVCSSADLPLPMEERDE